MKIAEMTEANIWEIADRYKKETEDLRGKLQIARTELEEHMCPQCVEALAKINKP